MPRSLSASVLLACSTWLGCGGSEPPPDVTVRPGQSIQAAINAIPKDRTSYVIAVEPGVYNESLSVDRSGVELRGVVSGPGDMDRPVLDGGGKMKDGLIASGSSFTMRGFFVRNYTGNGITAMKSKVIRMLDLRVDKTGLYGLYPVEVQDVLIEGCRVTGVADAGIYVGQSRQAVVRRSVAHGNVTGIEIENTVEALVEENEAYDNSAGILVFALPNNPSKVGERCTVRKNNTHDNNHANFGEPNSTVAKVPPGIGVLVMAAQRTVITDNDITGNKSAGVVIVNYKSFFPNNMNLDIDPAPDGTQLRGNRYRSNGAMPDKAIIDFGLMGADIIFDGMAKDVCEDEPQGANLAYSGITPSRCGS